jgi:hypothetical protein
VPSRCAHSTTQGNRTLKKTHAHSPKTRSRTPAHVPTPTPPPNARRPRSFRSARGRDQKDERGCGVDKTPRSCSTCTRPSRGLA